jgi:cytoskeletal protein CcmA (bactofilin family)
MGDTYTRQSSYTDGDVITAAHTNNEFNQLLAAFAASTGHTHDGTAAEGGPVTKLLGNGLTFGAGTAGTDITITFDGETNDGELKWMEDEDYFEFSDDILVASTEKLQFRDTAIYINSSTDGQLDLVADTEIQIAATTIDINGNVDISGTLTIGSAGISEAELEILDGATVTTTELNIIDGDTSATSTTVADADRVVFNDAGTMKQVAVTDLAAYFDDEITAMPNLVTTAATTVGALNSGSITSGFGTIDTGSSTITTTGLITGGSLDIDDVVINGTTIGHTDDTDLITVASGLVTIAGEISVTTLDIGGTNVTSTAAELNILDGVTATASELNIMDGVTATTAELNLIDGDTTATSTTLAAADRLIVNDAGTMKQVALSDFETFFESALDTTSNITTVGALNSGSITSGFGTIDTGSSTITTTGLITGGSLDIDDVLINGSTIGHTDDTDLITVANGLVTVAGEISVTTLDIGGTNVTSTAAELNILDGVTATTAELNYSDTGSAVGTVVASKVVTADANKDVASFRNITLTGELDAGSLDVSGDADIDGTLETDALSINGTAVTSTAAELNILDGVTATAAELNYSDTGSAVGTVVASKVVTVDANKDVASFRNITLTGELDAGSLDVSGNADIDGTLEADAITVNGATLNSVIADEATALAIALG